MTHIIKTKAFVLRTRPFKESSLFASVLTKKNGRVEILAKGCRRPKSKLCGTLEVFNLDEIIYHKRESKDVYTLSDAVIINDFSKIRAHPHTTNAAMVLCEFFAKTLPQEEKNTEAFALLRDFLNTLEKTEHSHARYLALYYVLKALSGAGVQPHLENCVKCHRAINYDAKRIDFSVAAGGVVCERDFDDTVVHLERETVKGLYQIYHQDVDIEGMRFDEIETLLPDYLYHHLNNLVLRSLKHLA